MPMRLHRTEVNKLSSVTWVAKFIFSGEKVYLLPQTLKHKRIWREKGNILNFPS